MTGPPIPPACPPLIIRRLCGFENTRAPRGSPTSSGPASPTSAIPPGDTPPCWKRKALPTVRKNVVTVVDHDVGMLRIAPARLDACAAADPSAVLVPPAAPEIALRARWEASRMLLLLAWLLNPWSFAGA